MTILVLSVHRWRKTENWLKFKGCFSQVCEETDLNRNHQWNILTWMTIKASCCLVAKLCSILCCESMSPIHGLPPTNPWDFVGKNTEVGCYFFLQEIFLTQELNTCLLPCKWILYHWATREAHMKFRQKEIFKHILK